VNVYLFFSCDVNIELEDQTFILSIEREYISSLFIHVLYFAPKCESQSSVLIIINSMVWKRIYVEKNCNHQGLIENNRGHKKKKKKKKNEEKW